MTCFQGFAYSAVVAQRGTNESVRISQHEMQSTPLYYFAFIYRFSYAEGRPGGAERVRDDLKS